MLNIAKAVRIAIASTEHKQGVIADLMGIKQPSLSNITQGKVNPSLPTLERLAETTGYKLSELIALGES
jgi:transcriptional regulator with XRE-family HTH domain